MPKAAAKPVSLDALFNEMQSLLAPYVRLFNVAEKGRVKVKGKRDYHLITKKEVTVDGRKYAERWFASLILQKGYVGFYFTPIAPSLKKELAPDMMRLLKGKSCFHVKALTPELKTAIRDALKVEAECYKKNGWV
jgi:hypothetical protein